jgi:RNA 2',3'-cyclic 3'-phosphodiesterase
MPRIFIALPFNADIINDRVKDLYNYLNIFKELKVVSPENYHITLKFLGDCSEKQTNKITENLNDNIIDLKKIIPFSLFGLGVFPDLKNPNVIWAGIRTDESSINKLNQSIENFASNFGIKKEKNKFTPHLTLARVRKGTKINQNIRQYLVENKELFFFESAFKRLVLFSSTLTKEGPVYTELQSIQLGQDQ